MWTEMHALLDHGIEGATAADIRTLIVEANVLAKRTLENRIRVWRKLRERYLLDPSLPAFRYFLAAYYREHSASQQGLLGYLLFCFSDPLTRHLGVTWLAPRVARPGTALRIEELTVGFDALAKEIPSLAQWTPTTRLRVFQHYLGAVRDFGLAEGTLLKRSLKPHVGGHVLVYAIRLAELQGLRPFDALQSVWVRLLGLDLDATITRMYQLNAEALARFRMAGDVVELSLPAEQDAGR